MVRQQGWEGDDSRKTWMMAENAGGDGEEKNTVVF